MLVISGSGGQKQIYSSKKECDKNWERGHRRINLNIVYSSWVSCKIKCGYSSDSEFARHLLSLEWRRRSVSTTDFYLNFMFFTPTVFIVVLSVLTIMVCFREKDPVLRVRVRREIDRKRKTVLRPNAYVILKVHGWVFVQWIAYFVFLTWCIFLVDLK